MPVCERPAVDVSEVYKVKSQALAAHGSIFQPTGDRLLMLYAAEMRTSAGFGGRTGRTFPGGEPALA
jgi:hypothetical protein